MGLPFTNLFASCCTSPNFVFGAGFATPHMALDPMCPLMCWLSSCGLCCIAVLVDMWQVILGEFPGRCTQCAHSATTWPKAQQPTMPRGHPYHPGNSGLLEVCRAVELFGLAM